MPKNRPEAAEKVQRLIAQAGERYQKTLASLGVKPFEEIAHDDPRLDKVEHAYRTYQRALDEARRLLPATPTMPRGWEGEPHKSPLHSLDAVRQHIAEQLELIRGTPMNAVHQKVLLDLGQVAVRNSVRALTALGDFGVIRFPDDASNVLHVEKQLTDLLAKIQSPAERPVIGQNEKRDALAYELRFAGQLSDKEITAQVKQECTKHGWPLLSASGIRAAIDRHLDRHPTLPVPPRRQRGRRPR